MVTKTPKNPVLESLQLVLKHPQHVSIDQERLEKLTETLAQDLEETRGSHWSTDCPINLQGLDHDQRLVFLFVFNAISFSYWGEPKWSIPYQGKTFERGTWSMIAALHRAVEEGTPLLDPGYLTNIEDEQLEQILRGNTIIPLLSERTTILCEVGRTVQERYQGNFLGVVEASEGDALRLVEVLVDHFPNFQDTAQYGTHNVHFRKRAQLLVSDLTQMGGYSLGNTDQLTACADYILPMVLRYHGVLTYSKELSAKVDNKIELPKGSAEEVEIRAHTIAAVEAMKRTLENRFTAMQINDALWLMGDTIPPTEHHHRTRTTAY